MTLREANITVSGGFTGNFGGCRWKTQASDKKDREIELMI